MNIHVQAMPDPFLRRVRETGVDDQAQAVRRMTAAGGEPCRDVLRRARPGEELILASFSPFSLAGPYKEFGPVFVLAQPSTEAIRRDALPLIDDTDGAYFRERFALRAYDREETIADAALVDGETALDTLARFFERSDVAFVDARFPAYGCFACRITRA